MSSKNRKNSIFFLKTCMLTFAICLYTNFIFAETENIVAPAITNSEAQLISNPQTTILADLNVDKINNRITSLKKRLKLYAQQEKEQPEDQSEFFIKDLQQRSVELNELITIYENLILELKTNDALTNEEERINEKLEFQDKDLVIDPPPYSFNLYNTILGELKLNLKSQEEAELSLKISKTNLENSQKLRDKLSDEWIAQKKVIEAKSDQDRSKILSLNFELLEIKKEKAEVSVIFEQLNQTNLLKKLQILKNKKDIYHKQIIWVKNNLQFTEKELKDQIVIFETQKNKIDKLLKNIIDDSSKIEKDWIDAQQKVKTSEDKKELVLSEADLKEKEARHITFQEAKEQLKERVALIEQKQKIWEYRYKLINTKPDLKILTEWKAEIGKNIENISNKITIKQNFQKNVQSQKIILQNKLKANDLTSQIKKYITGQLQAIEELDGYCIEYIKELSSTAQMNSYFIYEMELSQQTIIAKDAEKKASTVKDQYSELNKSFEENLKAEKIDLEQLKQALWSEQGFERAFYTELNAYSIRISSYNNMIILPSSTVEDLEKIRKNCQNIVNITSEQLKNLSKKINSIEDKKIQAKDLYSIHEKQLNDIKTEAREGVLDKVLLEKFNSLNSIILEKQDIIHKIYELYTNQLDKLKIIQKDFISFVSKCDIYIVNKKKQELFQRRPELILSIWQESKIIDEILLLSNRFKQIFSFHFWKQEIISFWRAEGLLGAAFFLAFGIIQLIIFHIRQFLISMCQKYEDNFGRWRMLILKLLQNSIPLLGALIVIYPYVQIRELNLSFPYIQIIINIMMILLFIKWVIDLLRLCKIEKYAPIAKIIQFYITILFMAIVPYSCLYLILKWISGSLGVLLLLLRFVFEIGFLVWVILLCKSLKPVLENFAENTKFKPIIILLIPGISYTIAFIGILLELSGYGQLALFWYTAWGKTSVIFLWSVLIFLFLQEWRQTVKQNSSMDSSELLQSSSYTLRWFSINISFIVLSIAFILGILIAFGAKKTIIINFFKILRHPVSIAGMQLSLSGFISAFIILLVIHFLVRLWIFILKNKILSNSGIALGLQESIATISVYCIWMFGILIALRAIGIGTTSITVAFGALGIGLGFGLQNIFNNFISGIILLFERPIQVGDAVEINGVWGRVDKINVRSTTVQTYDNAALVIPNSEFISNQVTNWSFKNDVKVRRHIFIGVAYGSDVELVRKTLIDIAKQHSKVYRYPEPDVLFVDFADSALMFRLRIWVHLDYCLTTESAIRFEVNRLFKEKNIEIPFPQRDVHLYEHKESD